MIVAMVGTNPYSFERMVRPLDELAGRYQWDVFLQLGHTEIEPRHCRFETFIERKKLLDMIRQSELVVTHGGFGSIRDALYYGKAVVAIPRKPEYRESQDYQEEMVHGMEDGGYVIGVYDIDMLEDAIERARSFTPAMVKESVIPRLISKYLQGVYR